MHRVKQACILSVASSSHPFCEIIYFGPFYTCQVKGLCHGQVHWFFESLEIAFSELQSQVTFLPRLQKIWSESNQYNLIMSSGKYLCYFLLHFQHLKKSLGSLFLLAYFAKIKLLLMMGGFRSWTKARLATKKGVSALFASWHFAWNFRVIWWK